MNCLIAKAAKSRAKYVNEKYYLGLDCNNCKSYLSLLNCYFAKKCTSSNCNCKCCEEEITTYSILSDCLPISATEIVSVCDEINISSNINYITCTMTSLESISYLLFEIQTLDKSAPITISSFIINGQEQLTSPITYTITPENINVTSLFGFSFINNIKDFLNSLNINDFFFDNGLGFSSNGNPLAGLRIKYPEGYNWQITTLANISPASDVVKMDGYIIKETGLFKWTVNNSFFNDPLSNSSVIQLNTVNDCIRS